MLLYNITGMYMMKLYLLTTQTWSFVLMIGQKSEVRMQESFIQIYTYKEYMELSLDIIVQYSLVNQNKERHGEHWDVTIAPEKPGKHQPYFESQAHTAFSVSNWRATGTSLERGGTRTRHLATTTGQRRIVNHFLILHHQTIKRLEISAKVFLSLLHISAGGKT